MKRTRKTFEDYCNRFLVKLQKDLKLQHYDLYDIEPDINIGKYSDNPEPAGFFTCLTFYPYTFVRIFYSPDALKCYQSGEYPMDVIRKGLLHEMTHYLIAPLGDEAPRAVREQVVEHLTNIKIGDYR